MTSTIETIVIDAGGRYGLHPTWKSFSGELKYYLFEPDIIEAQRLIKKYANRSDEITIVDNALLDKECMTNLFIFHNRAMSSCKRRNPISVSYRGERKDEENIIGYQDVKAITIDSFCVRKGVAVDFLKVDTEGTEYLVLLGAMEQLKKNILGIRCEVNFDYIFKDSPLFSEIHNLLLANNFYLLNLNYDGRGDYCNDFVDINGKYGILTGCDAVWLKRRENIFEKYEETDPSLEVRILKYAAFCLINNATDVAIDVLLEGIRKYGLSLERLRKTRLYRFVDISLHELFYRLKWQPGQSLKENKKIYLEIFGKRLKEMHEYNQSLIFNPD
jgi:FkbM family methyltransferase